MSLAEWEVIGNWAGTAMYAVATLAFVVGVTLATKKGEYIGVGAAVLGALIHLAALTTRGIDSGHLPVKGIYEAASGAALFITLPAAWIAVRHKHLRLIAMGAFPLALFLMGYAMLARDPATPLTPPYRSTWLVIHVLFANLCYGAFSLAFGAGAVYLVKEYRVNRGRPLGIFERLPELKILDEYVFRFVLFGFITCAMMIIAGAFWADALWGSYWNWDPVETWSLIGWLTYGLFIHFRLVHGWRGARLAWLAVAAIVFVVISFWGVNYMSGSQHVFLRL